MAWERVPAGTSTERICGGQSCLRGPRQLLMSDPAAQGSSILNPRWPVPPSFLPAGIKTMRFAVWQAVPEILGP